MRRGSQEDVGASLAPVKQRIGRVKVRGCVSICYEVLSTAAENISIPITAFAMHGGQSGRDETRPFGTMLVQTAHESGVPLRVVLVDRRNMGTSGICFKGENALNVEEADDLHALATHLKCGQCR